MGLLLINWTNLLASVTFHHQEFSVQMKQGCSAFTWVWRECNRKGQIWWEIWPQEKGQKVTVLLWINAAGDKFIILFIFPRVKLDSEIKKKRRSRGKLVCAQPNGWITSGLKEFLRRVSSAVTDPGLLIDDSQASHKNLDMILFAQSHHVQMLSSPPSQYLVSNSWSLPQETLKNECNKACAHWTLKYSYINIRVKGIAIINITNTKIRRMELAKSTVDFTGPI
jgi:hypothetical protein